VQDPPPSGSPRRRPSLLRVALLFYAVMLCAALLWAALSGEPLFYASQVWRERGARPWRDLGAGLLAGALVIVASREFTRRTRWGAELARALADALGPLSPASCAVLALASGIAEEAFFRGALQPRVGLVAASLIFGLAHFVPRRELLPWAGFSVAAGFLLGALFAATGNLLAPIAAHALVNGVNLWWLSNRSG
jgi:membrane protease YdiL (CAAX protease family)